MTERSLGIAAMIGACVIWGSSPLYFHALAAVPTGNLMAHRVLWSLLLFLAILAVQGRLARLGAALGDRRVVARSAIAALAIGGNWLLFLIAVIDGHVVQSSLGYYMFPLAAVLVGATVFGERLGRLRWTAVALAAAGVAILTLRVGAVPWLSLGIAATFAIYGALKKQLPVPPVVSVTVELVLLAPLALGWLLLGPQRPGAGFFDGPAIAALLAGSAVMTAVPLMLFTAAARRVELATVGVLQYLNPTLQFLVATLWFREPFTPAHLLAFGCIWGAVALYSAAALRRRPRLPARRAGL